MRNYVTSDTLVLALEIPPTKMVELRRSRPNLVANELASIPHS